jgi:Holliday junction resolvase-like predicted endonuclease
MSDEIQMSRSVVGRRKLGRRAEVLVAEWYKNRGFEVLFENLYLGHDELDLVVIRRNILRVVEVRSSTKRVPCELSWTVVGRKAHKLKRATRKLIYSGLLVEISAIQIDLALVQWFPGGGSKIEIWESALSLAKDD